MNVEVRTSEELKAAMKSGATEIVVLEESLATQLKAVKYLKSFGPAAVAGVVAAVPLIFSTGGLAGVAMAAAAPGAAWATSAIVALCISIGGAIAISLFTDWDYVELPFGIKLSIGRRLSGPTRVVRGERGMRHSGDRSTARSRQSPVGRGPEVASFGARRCAGLS